MLSLVVAIFVVKHKLFTLAVLEQPFLLLKTRPHRDQPVPDCVPPSLDPSQLALVTSVVKFREQGSRSGPLDERDRFLVDYDDRSTRFRSAPRVEPVLILRRQTVANAVDAERGSAEQRRWDADVDGPGEALAREGGAGSDVEDQDVASRGGAQDGFGESLWREERVPVRLDGYGSSSRRSARSPREGHGGDLEGRGRLRRRRVGGWLLLLLHDVRGIGRR